MATMKLAVQRRGGTVQRFDYATRKWVVWKAGEEFSARAQGMLGSYRLQVKARKLHIERLSAKRKQQYFLELPEGISSWTATGGEQETLPWEQADPYKYVLAMMGIPLTMLHVQPPELLDLLVAPYIEDHKPDRRRYETLYLTDGSIVTEDEGLRIRAPSYVVQMERVYPASAADQLQLWVTAVHVWPKTASGRGTTPKMLIKLLQGQLLSHRMEAWQQDLWQTMKKGG